MDANQHDSDVSTLKATLLEKMGRLGHGTHDFPEHIAARFPRILARIADQWGTAALDDYLDSLMLCDRDGRQGFPPEVAMELFHLISVHGALGLTSKANPTGWAGVDDAALEKKAFVKGGDGL